MRKKDLFALGMIMIGVKILLIKPIYNLTGFVVFEQTLEMSSVYLHFAGLFLFVLGIMLILQKERTI